MTSEWNFISEDEGSVTCHDHWISIVEQVGDDLVLRFVTDGFDVTKDNPLNPTGRHRNTGPAAVILKHWRWIEGVFNQGVEILRPDGTRYRPPETPLTRDMFLHELEDLEIYTHEWNGETGALSLYGDWYTGENQSEFCMVTLGCDRLLFCWNDLPRDAWFQDWPRN